ncbi:MAG TPA: CHAT domain-containing protein, partial [Anaerolineae bacterium]|nr:CHAT domain-containing protein [Anaerolineae bacterium]
RQLYHYPDQDEQQRTTLPQQSTIRQQIREIDKQISALNHQIDTNSIPTLSPHHINQHLAIDTVATHIPDDTIMLIYTQLDDTITVMGLTQSGLQAQQQLATPPATIETDLLHFIDIDFQRWTHAWAAEGIDYIHKQLDTFLNRAHHRLHKLYQALWAPIAPLVANYDHIVIIADQQLHNLPFHALYNNHQYLIENHTFNYAPNASLYSWCRQRADKRQHNLGHNITLMGYRSQPTNLPFVTAELNNIHTIYPQAQIFLDQDATPQQLQKIAPTCRLLHLATHGQLIPNNPFLSYIELASHNQHPHHFSAYDAAQLNLHHTELVTLSACETSRSRIRGGDLLGLQWGFFHAGAYALLANMWPVEDQATALAMHQFYTHYQQISHKPTALRQTQHYLRQLSATNHQLRHFKHPYLWAPYALFGFN